MILIKKLGVFLLIIFCLWATITIIIWLGANLSYGNDPSLLQVIKDEWIFIKSLKIF